MFAVISGVWAALARLHFKTVAGYARQALLHTGRGRRTTDALALSFQEWLLNATANTPFEFDKKGEFVMPADGESRTIYKLAKQVGARRVALRCSRRELAADVSLSSHERVCNNS